jgi:hypothetical protein
MSIRASAELRYRARCLHLVVRDLPLRVRFDLDWPDLGAFNQPGSSHSAKPYAESAEMGAAPFSAEAATKLVRNHPTEAQDDRASTARPSSDEAITGTAHFLPLPRAESAEKGAAPFSAETDEKAGTRSQLKGEQIVRGHHGSRSRPHAHSAAEPPGVVRATLQNCCRSM